jgi:hypothetical protein
VYSVNRVLITVFVLFFARPIFAEEQLIPEILALKDSQTIPASVIRAHSPNEIARSIVARLHLQHEKGNSEAPFLKDAEVQLSFPKEVTQNIISNGFLNIHQAERPPQTDAEAELSNTYDINRFREDRLQTENSLSLLKLDSAQPPEVKTKLDIVRPKSAYLVLNNQSEDLASFGGYGEIVAIPKRGLRSRMTWTPMDSYGSPEDLELAYTFQSNQAEAPEAFRYYEAQIWGELKPEDIQEWWVPPGTHADVINELKKTGAPVFQYEVQYTKLGAIKLPIRASRGMLVETSGSSAPVVSTFRVSTVGNYDAPDLKSSKKSILQCLAGAMRLLLNR